MIDTHCHIDGEEFVEDIENMYKFGEKLGLAFQLLLLKLTTPVKVQAHLANSNGFYTILLEVGFYLIQHLLPVGLHILGMQAQHGIAVVGIALANADNSIERLQIDAWHTDGLHASSPSA